MPVCPKCRAEYRSGITQCAHCEVALVAEGDLPDIMSDEEIIAAMSDEELVTVFEGPLAALRPVHDKLLAAGIPAALREGEELKTEMGLFIKLSLVVRKDDVTRVAELVGEEYRESLAREGLLDDTMDRHLGADRAGGGNGAGDQGEGGEEPAETTPACPACGCTEPLVDGECPECGLFLG